MFVRIFVLSVFVKGIRYIDVHNLQTGLLETCVTTLADWQISNGSRAIASSTPPPLHLRLRYSL